MRHHAATPLTDVLEKDLQTQVFELLNLLGWKRSYHVHDSRRSAHGFPDVVAVRDRVVYLELKREKTTTTPTQREWLKALRAAGAEVYVVRPRNFDALAAVLGARRLSTSHLTTVSGQEAQAGLLLELEKELAA